MKEDASCIVNILPAMFHIAIMGKTELSLNDMAYHLRIVLVGLPVVAVVTHHVDRQNNLSSGC
jgi:hypothetical protein